MRGFKSAHDSHGNGFWAPTIVRISGCLKESKTTIKLKMEEICKRGNLQALTLLIKVKSRKGKTKQSQQVSKLSHQQAVHSSTMESQMSRTTTGHSLSWSHILLHLAHVQKTRSSLAILLVSLDIYHSHIHWGCYNCCTDDLQLIVPWGDACNACTKYLWENISLRRWRLFGILKSTLNTSKKMLKNRNCSCVFRLLVVVLWKSYIRSSMKCSKFPRKAANWLNMFVLPSIKMALWKHWIMGLRLQSITKYNHPNLKARHGCVSFQRIQQCKNLFLTVNSTTQLLDFGDGLNLLSDVQ